LANDADQAADDLALAKKLVSCNPDLAAEIDVYARTCAFWVRFHAPALSPKRWPQQGKTRPRAGRPMREQLTAESADA
jgi:hypothetical protein